MIEGYLQYWGFTQHPFLLAPNSKMMYVAGQYYECLERLKYAIDTGKGGALLISEDAGLGKTTLILKLIDELKERHGDSFRYAFLDHPTLTTAQMIAFITESISGAKPYDDKLKNLVLLKDALIETQREGGKAIIVVDEGQMLCDAPEVLQELRVLINLSHENQYLHTFILSGQRALWNTLKGMPEFWQRLPVRFHLVPLQLEDTKGLIRHRLHKSGLEEGRDIFSEDAFEIIHRYGRGAPRTIIALADLALLVGFTNHTGRVTFKEVSKAINAMMGKGDSLPYVGVREDFSQNMQERPVVRERPSVRERPVVRPAVEERKATQAPSPTISQDGPKEETHKTGDIETGRRVTIAASDDDKGFLKGRIAAAKTFLSGMTPIQLRVAVGFLFLVAILGFYFAFLSVFRSGPQPAGTPVQQEAARSETSGKLAASGAHEKRPEKAPESQAAPAQNTKPSQDGSGLSAVVPIEEPRPRGPEAVVSVERANVRERPVIEAPVVGVVDKGVRVRIEGEKVDQDGGKWFKVVLQGRREGWMSDRVLVILKAGEVVIRDRRDML